MMSLIKFILFHTGNGNQEKTSAAENSSNDEEPEDTGD